MSLALVFTFDDKFITPFKVFFHSLIATGSLPAGLSIFVVHEDTLSNEGKVEVERFVSRYGWTIEFLDGTKYIPKDLPALDGAPVSRATYYRLYLHQILPLSMRVAVYLDVDMVAARSASELFSPDFSGAIAAADHMSPEDQIRMWGVGGGGYFQAGVLKIGLDHWRKAAIHEKFNSILQENVGRIRYWDQDVLNMAFENKWDRLPIWFNVGQHCVRAFPFKVVEANVVIAHFDNPFKPWILPRKRLLSSHWLANYREVFGQDFKPPPEEGGRVRVLARRLRDRCLSYLLRRPYFEC